MAETFETHLTVDKSIVEILSRSNYQRSFSAAIREMVSNAYDADATTVRIDTSLQESQVTIEDNGSGMTREDLDYYLRIAGKRREKLRTSGFNRKRIGKFGVGFLAIFPFCKRINVTTTTADSDEVVTADIPAADYFKQSGGVNVDELLVRGVVDHKPNAREAHYTRIVMLGLTDFAKASLSKKGPSLQKRRAEHVADCAPWERLKWELQDDLPLAFPKNSPYREFFDYSETDLIKVYLDGEMLERNDVAAELLESGTLQVNNAKARFAIATTWKPVTPVEMRLIKIRLNNVGVGQRDDFGVTRTRMFSRLSWITGELHIDEGLSDAISVGRDVLLATPTLETLLAKMADHLRKQASHVEVVEESRKTITTHVGGGKQRQVGPTIAVVEKNIKRLADRGFTVKKVQRTATASQSAVEIDPKKKVITLIEDHPSLRDEIRIAGTRYKLVFVDDRSPNGEPCVVDEREIRIFTKTPLFQSKRYGEVFVRFCILTVVAREQCRTAAEMKTLIMGELEAVFEKYL